MLHRLSILPARPFVWDSRCKGARFCHTNSTQTQQEGGVPLDFVFTPLKYRDTIIIKRQRFGTELEEFKKQYEAPLIDIFTTIKDSRKTLGNKRSRVFIKKMKPIVKKKKLFNRRHLEFIEQEKIAEEKLQELIETKPAGFRRNVLNADTPEKKRRRELLFKSILTKGNTVTGREDINPRKFTTNVHDKFYLENNFSDSGLAVTIADELTKEGITVDLGRYQDQQRERSDRVSDKSIFRKFMNLPRLLEPMKNTVADRPAVAFKPSILPAPPKKSKIQKVSDLHPIAFEMNSYPNEEALYDPFHTRKVILYVKVSALELPRPVKKRLIGIAKHREMYKAAKDMLIIKSHTKRTKRGNRRNALALFRGLLAEAWKGDLNYLPPPDKLLPHEQIVKQLEDDAAQVVKAQLNSFESIKQKNQWTLFRFTVIPKAEELIKWKVKAKETFERTLSQLNSLNLMV